MSFRTIDELCQLLVRLRLVDADELDECRAELDYSESSCTALLGALERQHLLTTYQTGKLAKGEADGLVLGEYKLLYRNAAGSFARVFRGCSLKDGSMVGLKLLRRRWAADPAAVAEFHREADLCMNLRHKNIVPIYEVGSDGSYHYFTMEFVEGGNLRDFIKIRGKLDPLEAARYVLDMAEGLAYAISRGVTHRDLKMTNVLISSQGVAKLADFGLAGNEEGVGRSDMESMQRALEYAALEKGAGAPRNDPRSDLFFLGAIFYELLTGQPPYPPTKNREERRQLSRYSSVREIRSADPTLPRCVTDIVARLMLINPHDRYQSAAEVVDDLKRAMSEMGAAPASLNGTPQTAGVVTDKPASETSTVMFIESRAKQQDMLRDYLSGHGFRVLMLNDLQRGLLRISNNPPDCVVLMGESIGDSISDAFERCVRETLGRDVLVIGVLGKRQLDLKQTLTTSETARLLEQPLTLRDLRREIHLGLQAILKQRRTSPSSGGRH